jgi:4-aminobutyrate aminotransferase
VTTVSFREIYDGDMTTTSHLAPVWFQVTDLQVSHGKGSWVYTTDGQEYLDFTSGIAVTSTGHSHPHVVEAIARQAARFIHAQVNVYRHDLLEPLAARLTDVTPEGIDRFFFANSGAEITEASVKLAKQVTKKPNIVVFSGSFHGRSHLAMAMTTSKTGYRAGHGPLPSGIFVAPYPDPLAVDQEAEIDQALFGLRHLLKAMTAPDETAAMILEPVLGEGGYVPAPARFITGVVQIARENGILFIADEVQSGFGRTGKFFAVDHYGIKPDIICMAKGIASGFPFAALGTTAELAAKWPTGSHGGTYGGNPIGCAAALATIEVMTADGFFDNVNARGEQLRAGLTELRRHDAGIVDVRGLGLMNGIQFSDPARVAAIIKHALEESHTLLMNAGTYGTTLRLMPPLVVTADEVELALTALQAAIKATS